MRAPALGVNVEIKPDGPVGLLDALVDGVLAALRERGDPGRFLITSFDLGIINRSRDLETSIPTGFLTIGDVRVDDSLERAHSSGHRAINPWVGFVDAVITNVPDMCRGIVSRR